MLIVVHIITLSHILHIYRNLFIADQLSVTAIRCIYYIMDVRLITLLKEN